MKYVGKISLLFLVVSCFPAVASQAYCDIARAQYHVKTGILVPEKKWNKAWKGALKERIERQVENENKKIEQRKASCSVQAQPIVEVKRAASPLTLQCRSIIDRFKTIDQNLQRKEFLAESIKPDAMQTLCFDVESYIKAGRTINSTWNANIRRWVSIVQQDSCKQQRNANSAAYNDDQRILYDIRNIQKSLASSMPALQQNSVQQVVKQQPVEQARVELTLVKSHSNIESQNDQIIDHGMIPVQNFDKYIQSLQDRPIGTETEFTVNFDNATMSKFFLKNDAVLSSLVKKYKKRSHHDLAVDPEYYQLIRRLLTEVNVPQEYRATMMPVVGSRVAKVILNSFGKAK